MSRLVTGLFYERDEAERAIDALRAEGLAAEDIYLETEIEPDGEIGRKGGEISRAEQERRFAGTETGLLIGLAAGVLSGIGVSLMAQGMVALMSSTPPDFPIFPMLMTSPLWMGITGGLLGLLAGGLIGGTVDYTLTKMGAGPAMPRQATLVTVRAGEDSLDDVYAALFRARARHLHVAQHMG